MDQVVTVVFLLLMFFVIDFHLWGVIVIDFHLWDVFCQFSVSCLTVARPLVRQMRWLFYLYCYLYWIKPCCVKWGNGIISILYTCGLSSSFSHHKYDHKIVTSAPGLPPLLTQHSPIHISITYTSSMCALSQWSLIIHQGILHLWSSSMYALHCHNDHL